MNSLPDIRKIVEETVERKLAETLSVELKFPVPLFDYIVVKNRKIKVLLEIYEDCVVAYLAQDRDIFAEGPTIRAAKVNLRGSMIDEHEFLSRHKKELSKELRSKLNALQGILE